MIAFGFIGESVGFGLRRRIDEQQSVGHVQPSAGRQVLLGQPVFPAQRRKHRPDQIAFRSRLVRLAGMGQPGKDCSQFGAQCGKVCAAILRGPANAFHQIVLGKQRTGCEERWIIHSAGLTRLSVAAKIYLNQ